MFMLGIMIIIIKIHSHDMENLRIKDNDANESTTGQKK